MITQHSSVDLATETGPMRCYIYRPQDDSKPYPAIIFYSEIFQQTAPIQRTANLMAGFGFVVVVPEVFHELNPIGTVLAYDDQGKDKGNQDKWTKPLEDYDSDNRAILNFLTQQPYYNGYCGAMGVCIGGHLAFRAALNPDIQSACCLYATDLHSDTLPTQTDKNTLQRCADIQGELLMIWGKQDPHIPTEGRAKVYQALTEAGIVFNWHEFNAQHAFMRDEGDRYDPELALTCYRLAVDLFHRTLTR